MYVVKLKHKSGSDWYPAWNCLGNHILGYYASIFTGQDVPKFDSADEAANWYESNKQQIMNDLDPAYVHLDFDNPEFVDVGDKLKEENIHNVVSVNNSKYIITSCGMVLMKGKTYSLDKCIGEYYYMDETMDINLLRYVPLFDSPEQAKQYCVENADGIFDNINGIDERCRSKLCVTKINFKIDVDGLPIPIVFQEENKNVCN